MILAERGGLCVLFNTTCCTYIPDNVHSLTMTTALDKLRQLSNAQQQDYVTNTEDWLTWLLSGSWKTLVIKGLVLIGVLLLLLCMFSTCILPCIRSMIDKMVQATVITYVGRYLDAYLKTFLTSAEQHFMLALPLITTYVFTDSPEKVPNITLASERQDISMMRIRTISETIGSEIRHKFRYVFCFDVDQEFKGRFGSEALGDSVALDFYYHHLVDACYLVIMEDKINNVEALWHDESHLNKYFWIHKPSRLLSPEYCWDQSIWDKRDILVTRLFSHINLVNTERKLDSVIRDITNKYDLLI
uniref:Uncharacterized protein n=1 Tax=Pundamilia nyererei TaxID=303518 RepID=A0A3B4F1G5_9CICH